MTAGGVLAASRIAAPHDEEPPPAGPVTAPVERRALVSEVVTRGEVMFADSTDVTVDVTGLDGPAVVTSPPPPPGTAIAAGDVLMETAGRPLIVLDGALPTYRKLAPGSVGPDVVQLEEALRALGHDPGAVDDTYDASTAAAVRSMYIELGHAPPEPSPERLAALEAAQSAASLAADAVRAAEAELHAAASGPPESERLALSAAVSSARRAVDDAREAGDLDAIAGAEEQLAIAQARYEEGVARGDTRVQEEALVQARDRLAEVSVELADARTDAGTPFPSTEALYLTGLPRRVDAVHVDRGDVIDGPVARVSGTTVVVRADLDSAQRQLVEEGAPAVIESATETLEGTIIGFEETGVGEPGVDASGISGAGATMIVQLDDVTAAEANAIREANVRVAVPIGATDGEVLVVPLAALSTGAGGDARVEVAGHDGSTTLVAVEVGLSAEGLVEIRPEDPSIGEGDRVVVGW